MSQPPLDPAFCGEPPTEGPLPARDAPSTVPCASRDSEVQECSETLKIHSASSLHFTEKEAGKGKREVTCPKSYGTQVSSDMIASRRLHQDLLESKPRLSSTFKSQVVGGHYHISLGQLPCPARLR